MLNNTNITPPRVPLMDSRTGLISREWYRFFLSLFQLTGGGTSSQSLEDLQVGPPQAIENVFDVIKPFLDNVQPSDESLVSQVAELQKQVDGLTVGPRSELGTMSQLQQTNLPWVTFDTTAENVPTDVGTVAWDGGTTLGIQMTANVLQRVGETEYIYVKASSAITKGQLCYHTGAVGASGVITVAPTPLNLADPNQIVGVAAESIANNAFGLIQISGELRGFNTTGSSVGQTWVDGDALYYNPAYVGSMTNVKPSAPNQKTYIGEVINASNAGSGSMHIRIVPGSVLGGTDSNVQFGTLANGDLIQYDSALQYWKNVPPSSIVIGTASNLAGGVAGSVPYQTAAGTTTFRSIGTANQVFRVNAGATAPEWVSGAALTETDDTNVTLTLGGSPSTALLASVSMTLGWTGQLAVSRGGTGNSSWTANGVLYASASNTLTNGSAVTYDGTTFRVTGKGSYLDPTFSTGGFNIVASYSYNDNNTNSIGSNFNNAHNIIHVRTSAGITSIPIYTNGGAGVAWAYNYLDPDAGSWAYSTTSPTITFTQNGTGGNTFSIVLNSNTGAGTIQRTAGTQSYTVSIQRLAV